MNIGVIGWWHQDNQGDLRILECMARGLAPHRVIPIDTFSHMNEDVLRRLNLLDFLILGGGGLFQSKPLQPFDIFDSWGPQLEIPIGVAGLGVDAVPAEYRAPVRALADQARFFYVRDHASQRAVDHPKVEVAPDLTFLYPLARDDCKRTSVQRVPVCGVNLRRVPHLEPYKWVQAIRRLPVEPRAIPFSTFPPAEEMRILTQLDERCAIEFGPTLYDGLDLMVGTAFHSVVFAVQSAVPVIAIAYRPKVRRLMVDLGLEQYALEPDEWVKLPELVSRVLDDHDRLAGYLREVTTLFTRRAQDVFAEVRREIESVANSRPRSTRRVSIVVVGTESASVNQATVTSCLDQTYENVEVIFAGGETTIESDVEATESGVKLVPDVSEGSVGECLNQAFSLATGEYLTWVTSGDVYAHDAIEVMASRLQQDPACDMVYSDYYRVGERNRIVEACSVLPAYKLVRRDVVGRCFLYRRRLKERVGLYRADARLPAYDYWLRAHRVCRLSALHVALFYELASRGVAPDCRWERQTRQSWRSGLALSLRAFWRVVDTDLVEHIFVRPCLRVFRWCESILRRSETQT